MNIKVLATVDLGSNSFRLLIARIGKDNIIYPIDQIKETIRLAGGIKDYNFTQEIQQVALETLARFAQMLAGLTAQQVRIVATGAFRLAKNAQEFVKIISKTLGFKVEIISGAEEARLIYIGASYSLGYSKEKRLVVDIGGSSTEFAIGTGYKPIILESIAIGCITFSNTYFANGKINKANFDNAILACCSKVQLIKYLLKNYSQVIGTSGTICSIYELINQNKLGDNITLKNLIKLKQIVIKLKHISNLKQIGVKAERSLVIAGGIAILIGVMQQLQIDKIEVTQGALREGVMYDFLGRKTHQDLRISTIKNLQKTYLIDSSHASEVAKIAVLIYSKLNRSNSDVSKILNWSAQLHELGLAIAHNDYHKHGSYILANASLAGFSNFEQSLLADLVRTHRGSLDKAIKYLERKRTIKIQLLFIIIALRLSSILNRSRQNLPANIIAIKNVSSKGFCLIISSQWLNENLLTKYSIHEEINQWLRLNIIINVL